MPGLARSSPEEGFMSNSYPKHRKNLLESQLVFINDTRERQTVLQTLSTLNRVIKNDNAECADCTADCVSCQSARAMAQNLDN
jgi:hypothetical protein